MKHEYKYVSMSFLLFDLKIYKFFFLENLKRSLFVSFIFQSTDLSKTSLHEHSSMYKWVKSDVTFGSWSWWKLTHCWNQPAYFCPRAGSLVKNCPPITIGVRKRISSTMYIFETIRQSYVISGSKGGDMHRSFSLNVNLHGNIFNISGFKNMWYVKSFY